MSKKKKKKNPSGKKKRGGGKLKQVFRRAIIEVFHEAGNRPLNYKQVSAQLNIKDSDQRRVIFGLLDDLARDGLIKEVSRGKYQIHSTRVDIIGRVQVLNSGSAYIISEESDEDVFVSQRHLGNAFHGDTVRVHVKEKGRAGQPSGEVVEVLERKRDQFVGIIEKVQKHAFLVPDDWRVPVDIYVPIDKLEGAETGQKAIVKITDWGSRGDNPVGEIIEVLGDPGDNETEMHAILAEYGLPNRFPDEIEAEADKIPVEITKEEIAKREDFREVLTFTIDPDDAKDFDDALSIRDLDNGHIEVGVHIADVTHYVEAGTALDEEAFNRATSVYLVDRVVPMLPEKLSNGVCSLRPNETKLTYAVIFELDEEAQVKNYRIRKTVIHSDRRFTYDEAQERIEKKEGDLAEEVNRLNELAVKLRNKRFVEGSIAFDKMEIKFKLDGKGAPIGTYVKVSKDANKLIEEFMLLANKTVASHVGAPEKGKKIRPFVYRVHDEPNPDKLQDFSNFVRSLGYKVNVDTPKQTAASINKLMDETKEKPEFNAIEQLAIRSMAKAIYTTDNIGHYGLAFSYYSHFTSPIRRYPDMMIHRLLTQYAEGKERSKTKTLENKCEHCSERERLAAEAERASIKYKQVEFMADKIGHVFKGVVSGVGEYGMWVEIIDNKCEGFVRMKEMDDDYYYFDEVGMKIVGKRYGTEYSIGDRVQILVRKANLVKKQLDFVLVDSFDE